MNKNANSTSLIKPQKVNFQDSKQVINFLKTKFQKRQYFAKTKLFWQLIIINKYHPKIISDVIDNLADLSCWKSYFLMLQVINRQKTKELSPDFKEQLDKLESKIYEILAQQYIKDASLYSQGKHIEINNNNDVTNINTNKNMIISTLTKWLPSKKSLLNKKFKFYAKFVPLVYQGNYNQGMNQITNIKKQLKAELGITDQVFYNYKQDDSNNINFHKLSRLAIMKHMKQIRNNPTLCLQYTNYLIDKYSKYDLIKFTTLLGYNYKLDEYTKIAINHVWNHNYQVLAEDFKKYYGIDLSNNTRLANTLLIDLSMDIINCPHKTKMISMIAILADAMSFDVKVIGSNFKVNLSNLDDVIKKYQTVITYVAPCRQEIIFKEQISTEPCIIILDKLKLKNFGSVIHRDSVVWELADYDKKLQTNKYPKFTKIKGTKINQQPKLIDKILYKYEIMCYLETIYKWIMTIIMIVFCLMLISSYFT
jgi:hypothetical protein